TVGTLDDPLLDERMGSAGADAVREEITLLTEAGEPMDPEAVARGEATPVFFGSALTNFGIDVLLERFLEAAPAPVARESADGLVDPVDSPFSGFVFKIQANMDLKHRDRVAFLRVCSGRFEAGADAVIARTGKTVRLSQPQEFMARERSHAEDAVAGDVVGLHDRGSLRVGDTVAVGKTMDFPGVPRFSPEHFSQVHLDNPMKRKQLDKGLTHLAEEGTVLLLFAPSITGPVPIVGAVGQLQFDVLKDRLEREYNVRARLAGLPYHCARWVTGSEAEAKDIASLHGRRMVEDVDGHPMILFDNEWALQRSMNQSENVVFHDVQPKKLR
ncbi:MAG: peptide chain release factor 3, partial [Gemmatimonadales bacterium]|nr:peptide chain release factor 3 [Gemmatimonadales bacterium]